MHIVVLPGDGIGPEITQATLAVLDAAANRFGLNLNLTHDVAGHESLRRHGTTLRAGLLETVQAADGLLMGPMSTYDYPDESKGGINPSGYFRKRLDLSGRTPPHAPRIRPGGGAREHRGLLRRPQHGEGRR
jgi:3-isopropylmalate dehydrogenase